MDRRVVGVALVLFVGVAVLLAGCGVQVGATQQIVVDEPLASGAVTEVHLVMGDGKLVLAPVAAGLVSGTIDLNVAAWKPKITRSDTRLTIAQGSTKGLSGGDASVVNDWNLKLGVAPMRLQIEAGAYEGAFELGGLSLQALDITDGAAKTQIDFTSPNPSQMERLRYVTGASTVTLVGLANANPAAMEFRGAAGTYVLDFSGQLRSDAKVEITIAAGSLRIEVPSTTRAQLKMKGTTAEVATQGSWTIDGSTYSTPAVISEAGGKTLTIELQMTAGSAALVCK
jgi:N-terminal domain of toast_rack, DUF2154